MIDDSTRRLLTELAEHYETPQFIVGDPSWWMHQVEGDRNREATAFVAQALSYGSRQQFMPRIGHLLDLAGGDMDSWLRNGLYRSHFSPGDDTSFYRLYSNATMYAFFEAYHALLLEHGSLGEYVSGGERVAESGNLTGLEAVGVICHWFSTLHSPLSTSTFPIPKDTASACKRVCMFLRWMVRDNSPVDLGLWPFVDKRTLIMPLDTHVVSEAVALGLLSSRCASMAAARRLTDRLAVVFPDDPLRGDFALFGHGVN